LFFGCFWYLYKGMVVWALIAFLSAGLTFGVTWFILPFFANSQHQQYLRRNGYVEPSGRMTRVNFGAEPAASPTAFMSPSVADELEKWARLRADGVINEEEFQAQKRRLL
jgi:hypothetical protein